MENTLQMKAIIQRSKQIQRKTEVRSLDKAADVSYISPQLATTCRYWRNVAHVPNTKKISGSNVM
ncbi:hypothetical protein WUBG_07975, partial [Wuchereria bancrofti]